MSDQLIAERELIAERYQQEINELYHRAAIVTHAYLKANVEEAIQVHEIFFPGTSGYFSTAFECLGDYHRDALGEFADILCDHFESLIFPGYFNDYLKTLTEDLGREFAECLDDGQSEISHTLSNNLLWENPKSVECNIMGQWEAISRRKLAQAESQQRNTEANYLKQAAE